MRHVSGSGGGRGPGSNKKGVQSTPIRYMRREARGKGASRMKGTYCRSDCLAVSRVDITRSQNASNSGSSRMHSGWE